MISKYLTRFSIWAILFLFLTAPLTSSSTAPIKKETLQLDGLSQPVEIIKDVWGISHIYAQNQKDLFFAQGFNVTQDRLFQLEIWRRQATGTLAEILGPKALKKDIGSRLLKFRKDLEKEFKHYHPQGKEIISSFVQGINAYIDLTRKNSNLLPLEFKLLGIRPGHWTREVVISRHNGLFRNATYEVALTQAINALGTEKVQDLLNLNPSHIKLSLKEGNDSSLISAKILELYLASRSPVIFGPEDIVDPKFQAKYSPDHYSADNSPFFFFPYQAPPSAERSCG